MTESEAIKKVKEFGLYHAIGDLPNSMLTVKAFEMAIKALEEIQQYRAIGTVKYFKECADILNKTATDELAKIIDEWILYHKIGTVEECLEARERQIPKKPIHDGLYACPNCHTIMLQGAFEARGKCCKECGQVLDWGETV